MASTYIFKKLKDPENQFDNTDVTIKVNTETLGDLLEAFKEYLLACGYQVSGDITIEESTSADDEN